MSWLLAILLGGLIGWVSSYAFRRDERNLAADTIAGALGAIIGVWLLGDLFGLGGGLRANLESFSIRGLSWTLLGSLVGSWIAEAVSVKSAREKKEMGTVYRQEIKEKRERDDDEGL